MKEIEQELHSIHSKRKIHSMEAETSPQVTVTIQDAIHSFATINLVSPSSPADIAVGSTNVALCNGFDRKSENFRGSARATKS